MTDDYPTLRPVLEHLIEVQRFYLSNVRTDWSHMSAMTYLKDHCTIKLAGPRGSGHTHAAAWMAGAHPNTKFLIATNYDRMVQWVWNKVKKPHSSLIVSYQHPDWADRLAGQMFDGVVLDTAGQISPKKLEQAYEIAALSIGGRAGMVFPFIILG